MIVKIWPIKAVYNNAKGKVGGRLGIKYSLNYICDAEKTATEEEYIKKESDYINNEKDIGRVIDYMANEDKTKKSYISGYLCDPVFAVQQFMDVKEEICQMTGRNLNDDKGNVAYHIVQSFPIDQDISDEEVHQCGIELCKKIGIHQAVICSHLNPIKDEIGKLHGEQKHNHILINSYIHPDFFDIEHPNKVKYHDCKETYEQLQIWNDEIALEHGFPIISEPDLDRSYSWYEQEQKNENASWMEQIRIDINNAKRISSNWDEFKENMLAANYELKEGKYITYIAPDKKHKARGNTLGKEYTKEYLTEYWQLRKEIHHAVLDEISENKAEEQKDNLKIMLQIPDQQVFIKLPLKKKKDYIDPETGEKIESDKQYVHYFPINDKITTDREVLQTYFNPETTYDICDQDKQKIGEITGQNLVQFISEQQHLSQLHQKDKTKQKEKTQQNEFHSFEHERKRTQETKEQYYQEHRYNSRTKKRYYINLYDQNGRRRSTLELMLLLAIVIIKNESDYWTKESNKSQYHDYNTNPIYGTKDKKIQNMIDSLHIAREQNITTPAEIENRLQEAGVKLGRTRFQLNKTEKTIHKMEKIHEAIKSYQTVKSQCEFIRDIEDPAKKEKLIAEYSTEIDQYKAAKAVLYKYKITNDEEINQFINRWNSINEHRDTLKDNLAEQSNEYRKLKKLQYHTKLSQDDRYVYGPDYVLDETIFTRTRGDFAFERNREDKDQTEEKHRE